MSTEKALALVVRGSDWSETSRISTLFTREFGKVRGLAKGGRRLRSSFEIAFDLLTVCHIVFIRKSSGGLDLLTEAQLVEQFPVLRTDLTALYAGYYVAELLADGTQDYDPHPALFDAAIGTLRALGGPGGSLPAAVGRFELVWLRELGYGPRLDACASCGSAVRPPTAAGRIGYSQTAGGVVCQRCEPAARDRVPLSVASWAAARDLSAAADEPGGPVPTLSAAATADVRHLLGQAVSFVLGRRPRMLGYLDGR